MISKRPYLLRALNDWIIDNGLTPHVLVDAKSADVQVPSSYIQDGKIVLNISPSAVRDLVIDNDILSFNARFSGTAHQICVPINYVIAVYARENGEGMIFPEESTTKIDEKDKDKPSPDRISHLKVIK